MKNTVKAFCYILILCVCLSSCRSIPYDVDAPTAATTATTTAMPEAITAGSSTQTEPSATTTPRRTTTTTKARTTAPSAKPSYVTAPSGNGVKVSAEYVSQSGFPTGCESASATMLLRFWGVDMTLPKFVDNYLDTGAINYTSSGTYAPHPAEKFVGNPRSQYAYGCYAPVIVRAITKCLPTHLRVINETGKTLSALCKEYLDAGMPVMVWATINMVPIEKGGSWKVQTTGETFQWPAGEHCLLLVGYDSSKYYLLDPYKSKGLVAYPRATVEARYAELGHQAVGIQRIPTTTITPATNTTVTTTVTTTTATIPDTEPSVSDTTAVPTTTIVSDPSDNDSESSAISTAD